MSPPQLTADTPVSYVFHPVQVNTDPAVWRKAQSSAFNRFYGLFGEWFHFYEPLIREVWFDNSLAALTMANCQLMVFYFFEQAEFAKLFNNSRTSCEAIHAFELASQLVHYAAFIHYDDLFEVVAPPHLEIVGIVSRSNLNRAGTKRLIDEIVYQNWYFAVDEWQHEGFADKIGIALVVRIDRNGNVTKHGFWSGCSYNHVTLAVFAGITNIPEITVGIFWNLFFVRKGCSTTWTPVNDVFALVDQAILMQFNKTAFNSLTEAFIHGKALAFPVA
ncbi:MAG: hypothetical protein ACD_39C00886G0003 [uncultured bacterium]|nr:MAG: hypothetical protein ACD_39C00886G0003 [uncultured bacterium]